MNQDNQKTKNTHKPRNTKSAQRKKATETILPTVEEAKLSLPPHLELLPSDTDETPTLIDREHYGTTLKVKHGHVYTLRLGVHCYSGGLATFRDDCAASCFIPATPGTEQYIIGLFFVPEIYPAKFMDVIHLKADKPFRLRYIWGSAVLENNNNAFGFTIGNDSITTEKDGILVYEKDIRSQIHDCHRVFFDVLRIQVEICPVK